MSKFNDKKVLITGGCSGIGLIMARKSLERGASRVIIWDINQKAIDAVVEELSKIGAIEGYCVDISSSEAVLNTASEVGPIDILINNAGIVVGKSFADHSIAEIDRTININTSGAMYVTKAFLGGMITTNQGHICNIASSAGYVANPNMSVYAASKWAVVGWSDSVRIELKRSKSAVRITTIMPYFINTGMFDGVKSRIPILKPEVAAEKIIRSIEKNAKLRSIYGILYPFTRTIQGLLPLCCFDFVADKMFGIYDTMKEFKGRK
ncbi:MAG: SDR family NAD(P)-dependent oxidoreductase [Rikenellaceae bacterium]